jgi:hypothetical protein
MYLFFSFRNAVDTASTKYTHRGRVPTRDGKLHDRTWWTASSRLRRF